MRGIDEAGRRRPGPSGPALGLLALTLLMGTPSAAVAAAEEEEERAVAVFGTVPIASQSLAKLVFLPLLEHFATELARKPVLKVSTSYEQFLADAHAGAFDYIMPPPHYVGILTTESGFELIAESVVMMRAVLFTYAESDVANPTQLVGKRLLLPSKRSSTTALGRHLLGDLGLPREILTSARYLESHDAVILSVLKREAVAGIVPNWTLDLLTPALSDSYRILAESIDLPEGLLMAKAGSPPGEIETLTRLLEGRTIEGHQPDFAFRYRIPTDAEAAALIDRVSRLQSGEAIAPRTDSLRTERAE